MKSMRKIALLFMMGSLVYSSMGIIGINGAAPKIYAEETAGGATASNEIPDNHIRIHYQRADGDYEHYGLWLWGDVTTPSEAVAAWPTGATAFTTKQRTDYGVYLDIPINDHAHKVNFIVLNRHSGEKDANEKSIVILTSDVNEGWVTEGSDDVYYWEPVVLPENTLRVHYQRADRQYEDWGLWLWDDVEAPSESVGDWPTGAIAFDPTQTDRHGAYLDIKLADRPSKVSFLLVNRQTGEKDGAERSFVDLDAYEHLFVKEGDPLVHTTPYTAEQEESQANFPDWSKDSTIYEVNVRQYTAEGTFEALEAHLPVLQDLGVEILWLMPIHPISSEKRLGTLGSYYAAADFKAVNPEFGTMEDFKRLVDKAHDMGFKVVLDWVANHTGWDHVWIDHTDWYVTDAEGNIQSPQGWSDVAELNFDSAEMRAAMIDAMKYWVAEADIDGYRADHAAGVPRDFWEEARKELETIKPVYMLAEDDSQPGLLKEAFHANYGWDLFYNVLKGIPTGDKGANDIKSYVKRMNQLYPKGSYPMNFITNHDTNSWEGTTAEMFGDAEKAIAALSFTLPGMPLIYSGQEVGLDKRLEFFEKDEIDWDDPRNLRPFYKKLIQLKKQNRALYNGLEGGEVKFLETNDPRILAFQREKDGDRVFSIFNLSADHITSDVELGESLSYISVFEGTVSELQSKQTFSLEPWEVLLFSHTSGNAGYTDLSEVPWAEDAIQSLATKGIITVDGTGLFLPKKPITRAEFASQLVTAFNLARDAMLGANDSNDEQLVREEMIVMAVSALDAAERNLDVINNGRSFMDADKISPYAVEAVELFNQAGLLEGRGAGYLQPRAVANRAEAAVLIDRLLQAAY